MLNHFPAIHTTLHPQALVQQILPQYGLDDIRECCLYSGGFNDTYRIITASGETFYLRAYRSPWRTPADVFCELDALMHLHQKSIPVAHPLRRLDGGYATMVPALEGPRLVAVFHLAPGVEPDYTEDAPAKAHQYGRLVASLHNALQDFSSPHQRFHLDLEHFIEKPLRMIQPFLAEMPQAWEELQGMAETVRQRILARPAQALEWGFCHGDLQGYHHRIAPDGSMTFIDFDCGGFGYRAYDLAVFRWCARLSDLEAVWWPPYLQGYREVRPLAALDELAVPDFVACRYIWHMGVHCENAPDWGCGWLNEAYFTEKLGYLRKLMSELP
jgi:Ser/Thr protein kinase RdoA (MazF antagonist)